MTRTELVVLIVGGLNLANGVVAAERYPFPTLETSWSGTRMMEANGLSVSSKVYQTPEKLRYETEGTGGVVVIHRQDLGVQWMLISDSTYMETSLSDLDSGSPEDGVLPDGVRIVEQDELGTRTIDGWDTRGYRVVTEDQEGTRAEVETWVTGEGIPVHMQIASEQDGKPVSATIRTTDIRIAAQPDRLFEVPADATRLPGGSAGTAAASSMLGGIEDAMAEEARAGAEEGARGAVQNETRERAEDALRKGFKKLFGN
jgi:hypothetical protein